MPVRSDPVRRFIYSRRGISAERSDLVLVGGAVDLHGRTDEAGEGAREAVARVSPQTRVIVDRKGRHRLDDSIHRHAAVESATNLMGCDDQAWRVCEGGDAMTIK
ncbi:hypothetical protein A4G28_02830 [Mycobacterium ostraviense]|uniref:Uncharacterized protein n=1 Tax=Mycobacterium ostraviense TaxID=2738409 RepID=A0A163XBP2_9MYCO|nr:hypothetical protein A4G28_02830 [Mycobacterium ostraviense]